MADSSGAHFSGGLLREGTIERRLYQETIAASALSANTLVVLPTALGKTAIAALVISARLSKHGGTAVIISPTKPLAEQHAKTLAGFLQMEPVVITGETPPEKRRALYSEAKLISCTAPAIRNDLLTGAFSFSGTTLAIFDEAHHCVKSDSYVFLAAEYQKTAKSPLILALTASPGHTKEKVDEICRNLFISRIEARNEKDGDVAPYVAKVSIDFREVSLPAEFLRVRELLMSVLRGYLRGLKGAGLIESADSAFVTKRELLAAKSRAAALRDFSSIAGASGAIKIIHSIELLETQGIFSLLDFLGKMAVDGSKSSRQIQSLEDFRQAAAIARGLSARGIDHPKLAVLVSLLKSEGRPSIVFTHYRAQAKKVADALGKEGLAARIFLGQKEGFTQKEQKRTIEEFRSKGFQILVSTSVGEEGIDIPAVDLIVFYEPVPSAIRHIQRRGRTGRKDDGRVIVLFAKGTRDEAYRWISHRNERAMKEIISSAKLAKREDIRASRTLNSFLEQDPERPKPKIVVDSREAPSGLIAMIRNATDAEIEMRALPVADIVISDTVAIERKAAQDFVGSLLDGRLFEQAGALAAAYERPLMIIEAPGGLQDLYSQRNIHPNAIRGALASIALDFGIPVLFTKDSEETAALISLIVRRETEPGRAPQLKGKLRAKTLSGQQEALVASLPDVNLTISRRLLAKFKTPERAFSASEKELSTVNGIGPAKAAGIRRVLSSEEEKQQGGDSERSDEPGR